MAKKTKQQMRKYMAERKAAQRKRDAAIVLEVTGLTIPQLIRVIVKRANGLAELSDRLAAQAIVGQKPC